MSPLNTSPPPPGLCSFEALPDPYQTAFRQGSAHHLPGKFLAVEVDWFTQIFLLPFWLIYALPPISVPLVAIIQGVQNPESYRLLLERIGRQNTVEMAVTIGLVMLLGLLLVYSAWTAWDSGSSFVRTWQASQFQRRHEHGFGLVLMEQGLVARLIDNIENRNCFWIPREAIANIIWHEMPEEGVKHSRWVYRTCLCYVTQSRGQEQKRWLTLKGNIVKTGYPIGDKKGDRALYEQLYHWWQTQDDSVA